MSDDKSRKLGMSFATARARLDRDILFKLATDAGHKCFRCGGDLTRDTLSVEHKQPWQRQSDPKLAFFDLSNIAFSHMRCNAAAPRRYDSKEHAYVKQLERKRDSRRENYSPEHRSERYRNTGH